MTMARFLWMTLLTTALLCLGACDTIGDDDDDDDDDTTEERLGLAGKLGAATALAGTYDGYEELYFVAEKGAGDDVCRIHYTATSVAERTDCVDCDWAYDLRFTGPSITAETDVGCLPTLGYDADSVNDIDGTSMAYGYIAEYFGHAQVMTLYTEATDSWDVVTFASWDAVTGEFSYDWEDTFYPY